MKHHYTVTLGLRAIGFLSCCLAFATCLVLPSPAMSGPSAKEVEVNGVRLHYVEEGSGDPMIVVHGGASDLRTWEPLRERIAAKYRFIAYTQRYFGTGPWPDEGQNFSVATHADDLAKFITSLNAGPVHLVGWSYGGTVATVAAVKNPSLVRSLIVYESGLVSVLSEESVEGKAAREDRAKIFGPAIAAAKAGDAIQAAKLLREGVMQLGPGGFDREPQATQTRVLDNARTVPLAFAAPPSPAITCDMLKNFARPTLVMRGDKTQPYFALISDAISKCVPAARLDVLKNVHHGGPHQDPAAFTAAVFEFLSQRAFLIAPR